MTDTNTLEVTLEAIDPLLFGDNRSARAGADHVQTDQDPSPATLYGAVGARIATVLGARPGAWSPAEPVLGRFCDHLDRGSRDRSELLGYVLRDGHGRRWFPSPLHLRILAPGRRRVAHDLLLPVPPATALSSIDPLWRLEPQKDPAEDPRPREADEPYLVSQELLAAALTGAALPGGAHLVEPKEVWAAEPRIGLAIENRSGTAREGLLFSRPYRRFAGGLDRHHQGYRRAGFTAWFRPLDLEGRRPGDFDGVGFLGGDRRRAHLRFAEQPRPLSEVRRRVLDAVPGSQGFLVYLLTPAVADGSLPQVSGQEPLAAAVGRAQQVSGWRAGPRRLRTLIPAGSVLFYRWPETADGEESRRALLSSLWFEPVAESYRNPGFGRMLAGVWSRAGGSESDG